MPAGTGPHHFRWHTACKAAAVLGLPENPHLSPQPANPLHDVLIVGAGPAGLSAALLLGRCCRNVVIFDSGEPRNAPSPSLHGYLTRDGTPPLEFLQIGREELERYPAVTIVDVRVEDVARTDRGFTAFLSNGQNYEGRKILLATGLKDRVPAIAGFEKFYGHSAHHCPYCDGWEHRNQRLAVVGSDKSAADLAMELLIWSPRVTLFTNAEKLPASRCAEQLKRLEITIVSSRIKLLTGNGNQLTHIVTHDESHFPCDALFFSPGHYQPSPLCQRLGGPAPDPDGAIDCPTDDVRAAPGVYAAGNATTGIQMVIMAAAEGMKAAAAINAALQDEDQLPKLNMDLSTP